MLGTRTALGKSTSTSPLATPLLSLATSSPSQVGGPDTPVPFQFTHLSVSQDHCWKVYLLVWDVHGLQRHVLFGSSERQFLIFNTFLGGILLLGWVSTSIPRPPIKRAAAIAIVNGFANIGQIPTSYLWPSKWAPKYWQSFTTELCLLSLSLAIGLGLFPLTRPMKIANQPSAYRQYLAHLNEKLQKGETEVFKTDEKALATSAKYVTCLLRWDFILLTFCASLVNATADQERQLIRKFRYLL